MHRNTYLLVILLAITASLLVGINVGKRMSTTVSDGGTIPTPSPIAQTPTPANKLYTNTPCGFTLVYPNTLTLMDNASGSALLVHTVDKDQSVAIACQEEIPRPPLMADKIETTILYNETKTASVTARLYHDASAQDGTPLDEFIFTNPKTGLDVFIAGFGQTFDAVIQTVRLIP